MNNKKYNILSSLISDAPYGNINWYSISFLTPQNIDKLKNIDIKAFKVHNGYNTTELANNDAKEMKKLYPNHDIYICETGKIYCWDDATKSDVVEYDDKKLNDLEKTRKQHIDTTLLMKEQFKGELKTPKLNPQQEKKAALQKKMQERLYKKGLITLAELEKMQNLNINISKAKNINKELEVINEEIANMGSEDYLDENSPTGLKYGCITIYSPKRIGGLNTLCYKIRGLFDSTEQLNKRIAELKITHPHDNISSFEIGKWTGFSEYTAHEPEYMLKLLNYCMKSHNDNMAFEKQEFDKRTKSMQSQTQDDIEPARPSRVKGRCKGKQARKNKVEQVQSSKIKHMDETDKAGIDNILNIIKDDNTRDITNDIENIFDEFGYGEDVKNRG